MNTFIVHAFTVDITLNELQSLPILTSPLIIFSIKKCILLLSHSTTRACKCAGHHYGCDSDGSHGVDRGADRAEVQKMWRIQ